MKQAVTPTSQGIYWRHILTAAVVVGSLVIMLLFAPFGQNPQYHDFADKRAFFGIPNFFDVA
jgi:hypothetical protein